MKPVFFLLIVIVLAVAAYLAWQVEQERRQALRAWAAKRRWKFTSGRRDGWHRDHPGVKLFERGHSRRGKNVIRGEVDGRPVTLVDYRYTTGHGKNRTNHRKGAVILECGFPTVPLSIRREHALDKVGEFLGADDIDFESAEFSRRFHVESADRKWAYDVIHTRAMDYLLGAPPATIEFGFGEIVVYRNGGCDPRKYEELLEVAGRLFGLIPDFVVRQMKGPDA